MSEPKTYPPNMAASGPDFDEAVKTRIALLGQSGALPAVASMQAIKAETAFREELRADYDKEQAKAEKKASGKKEGGK